MVFSVNRRNSLRSPACAGKSSAPSSPVASTWDHPRVCGEKRILRRKPGIDRGSPPRVRGKVTLSASRSTKPRITPACAGKSILNSIAIGHIRDHPRVCGEKQYLVQQMEQYGGSPPRVRGKGGARGGRDDEPGITPACAGKSLQISPCAAAGRDHPRVCGEKGTSSIVLYLTMGSPPRVRRKD